MEGKAWVGGKGPIQFHKSDNRRFGTALGLYTKSEIKCSIKSGLGILTDAVYVC